MKRLFKASILFYISIIAISYAITDEVNYFYDEVGNLLSITSSKIS